MRKTNGRCISLSSNKSTSVLTLWPQRMAKTVPPPIRRFSASSGSMRGFSMANPRTRLSFGFPSKDNTGPLSREVIAAAFSAEFQFAAFPEQVGVQLLDFDIGFRPAKQVVPKVIAVCANLDDEMGNFF